MNNPDGLYIYYYCCADEIARHEGPIYRTRIRRGEAEANPGSGPARRYLPVPDGT